MTSDKPSAVNLEEEWFEQNNVKTWACPVPGCGRVYHSKGKVSEHITKRHSPQGTPRYKCTQEGCRMSFCRMDALKAHHRSETHEGVLVVYEKGTDEALRETTMRESEELCERLQEAGGVQYRCALCTGVFSEQGECLAHIASLHISKKGRPYACPDPACPRIYVTRNSLNRHKRLTGHMNPSESETSTVSSASLLSAENSQLSSPQSIMELTQFITSLD